MPGFIVICTILTIGVTAVLVAILWNINNPQSGKRGADQGGGDAPVLADAADAGRGDFDSSDGGGGDGGGD